MFYACSPSPVGCPTFSCRKDKVMYQSAMFPQAKLHRNAAVTLALAIITLHTSPSLVSHTIDKRWGAVCKVAIAGPSVITAILHISAFGNTAHREEWGVCIKCSLTPTLKNSIMVNSGNRKCTLF